MILFTRQSRQRKTLVVVLAMLFALVPGGAFGGGATEETVDGTVIEDNQAPQLRALVDSGELPPLDERIPTNPMVVTPREEIGQYGGEIRGMVRSTADGAWFERTVKADGLVVWNPEWSQVVPGYAAEIDISDDVRQFTFVLREGLHWSDGEPMTTADIAWWWEHEMLNEELTPNVSSTWRNADGTPADVEVIDELTFRVTFNEPKAFFLDSITYWNPTPMHYARSLHGDFNEDADELARRAGYDGWVDYYSFMIMGSAANANADLPVMFPWKVTEGATYTGEHTRITWNRNPYYYRVDTEGNQLPYIDTWHFDVYEEAEVLQLQILAGEVDFHFRHLGTSEQPLIFEGQNQGDYSLVWAQQSNSVTSAIALNMTHDDDTVREIAQNRDFRVGLSYAINRNEINEILLGGQSQERQPSPHEQMDFYHERLATQYTEYDPALAREYFDRAGYREDENGYRIGPDGNPIVIRVDIAHPRHVDEFELIETHWAEVGIQTELNVMDRSLFQERFTNNQHEAIVWYGEGGLRDALTDPRDYFPRGNWGMMAPRWAAWQGDSGTLVENLEPEAPPAEMQRQMELFEDLQVASPENHAEIMYEILDIAADVFPKIGTVSRERTYGVITNRIGNPIHDFVDGAGFDAPGSLELTQLFIRN